MTAPDSGRPAGVDRGGWPPFPRELLERVRRREPEALDSFFEHYFDRVFALVARLLGDRTRAEDVTQEVFLKVHRHLERLDPARDPAPWLYTVATNACRDVWRSGAFKLERRSVPVEDEGGPLPLASSTPGPERELLTAERARRVQEAIDRLPPEQREAVLLHDYEGLDHQRVADLTGVNHAAARKRYSRALRALAASLKDVLG